MDTYDPQSYGKIVSYCERSKPARMLLVLTLLCFLAGCDAFMAVSQRVEIAVADRTSGGMIAGADVDLANADRINREVSDVAWLDSHTYRRQTTDTTGHASLNVDIAWIAGVLFKELDAKRDRLTDTRYLFRVGKEALSETLIVEMRPGVTSDGKQFAITVLSIGKPTRLSTTELSEIRHGAPVPG